MDTDAVRTLSNEKPICFFCKNADFSSTDVNQLTESLVSFSFHCNKCELADAYGFNNLRRETIECNVKTLEFWVDGGERVDACKNYETRIETLQDLMKQNKQLMGNEA